MNKKDYDKLQEDYDLYEDIIDGLQALLKYKNHKRINVETYIDGTKLLKGDLILTFKGMQKNIREKQQEYLDTLPNTTMETKEYKIK